MEKARNLISTLVLRRLLYDLVDKRSNTLVRFRLLGEMWKPNFMQPVKITEKGAIFNDTVIEEFVHVGDLGDVLQFELDARFQEFQPHFHYEVKD